MYIYRKKNCVKKVRKYFFPITFQKIRGVLTIGEVELRKKLLNEIGLTFLPELFSRIKAG